MTFKNHEGQKDRATHDLNEQVRCEQKQHGSSVTRLVTVSSALPLKLELLHAQGEPANKLTHIDEIRYRAPPGRVHGEFHDINRRLNLTLGAPVRPPKAVMLLRAKCGSRASKIRERSLAVHYDQFSPSRTAVLGCSSPASKTEMFDDKAFARKRIADINDKFRKSLVTGGRTYMTAGVNSKGPEFVARRSRK